MKFLVLFPDYNMVSDASIDIKAVDISNILGKSYVIGKILLNEEMKK